MPNHGHLSGFLARFLPRRTSRPPGKVKVLVLLEGRHDVAFLAGLSSILHRDDPCLPDLRALEQTGEVIFVPVGGGDVIAWAGLLAVSGGQIRANLAAAESH